MIENLILATLFSGWIAAVAVVISYQPDHAILYCRIFAATCIGIARLIGIA